ncbi:MAG: hypothetical protein PHY08_13555, partial [Candidatus Cloacimonetes bacterium]|nr:hypothetical protein [Candidatus Cloacimonadota bacterium]
MNIIELREIGDSQYSSEIVNASIDQKIGEISIFNFKEAVQYKDLKFISVYFLLSIIVSLSIFSFNKSLFTNSTYRIVHYKEHFEKPAPYNFYLKNENLEVKKGEPYTIFAECLGSDIPEVVYINIGGNSYVMKNSSPGTFEFEIASVINPLHFFITDLKYRSEDYFLTLLPAPGITGFTVTATPPAYTGLTDAKFENTGDLQIPGGTKIKWSFQGVDIDSLYFLFSDSSHISSVKNENVFNIEKYLYKSSDYQVYINNRITEPELTFSYSIDVIPDLYPEINVIAIQDSTRLSRYFYKGLIVDDYGFTALNFHYNVNNSDSLINIPVVRNLKEQEFYFSFDFADAPVESGVITCYFTVTDNDVINNYKTTSSESYIVEIPDKNEILAE